MLEGIDEVPWKSLKHCRGKAFDVPKILRDLASSDPEVAMEAACDGLWDRLCHQGTLYEASRYAIPYLLELLRDGHLDGKATRRDALAYLATCTRAAQGQPPDLDMRDRLIKGREVYHRFSKDADPKVKWNAAQLANWCEVPLGQFVWPPERQSTDNTRDPPTIPRE
jgi:hypothetical protein